MNAKARIKFFAKDARITFKQTVKKFDGKADQVVTTLMGYPILWNQLSSDRGGYSVRIPPEAAVKFADPCFALFHHDFAALLGNTANDTLRIGAPDKIGIPVEIDLPDTSWGRDTGVLVRDGYCKGMSFSMVNGFEDYTEAKEAGTKIVNCTKFTCDDITITPNPAFIGTSIGPKDDDDDEEEELSQSASPLRIESSAKLDALKLGMLNASIRRR